MPTTNKKSRNIFSTANRYQDKIVFLSFFPSVFIFLTFILVVMIGNPIITKAIFNGSYPEIVKLILSFTGAIIFLLCLILLMSMILSFIISHHIVGPFGRIIKELDSIIEGNSTKPITSRPGDDLAKDLLKRINVLVAAYVKNNSDDKK